MKRLIALALAATMVVAACSSSTEDAVGDYCDDLGTLQAALQSVSTLSASSSVDDVNAVGDSIKDAYNDVVSSADGVDDAVTSEIEAAQKTFTDSVNAISGDASVSDALADLQAAEQTYVAAVDAAVSKVSCP